MTNTNPTAQSDTTVNPTNEPGAQSTIRLPTILRNYTNGNAEVPVAGATLGDAIDDLEQNYPGLRARILDDNGDIRRFVNVYVNDEDVRFAGGPQTALPAGSSVSVLAAVAGG
ncbi:MoaD/ThiS family protein [Saxibacter everestensis]|uniref:MoaD/ThiS family protein n=1 Tax=Saxibacter everestensis TaxID=2909229 RepID=A0ABY8QN79_9MICO|nr:MoaD/ThiS family protein [Brevibacteriaceae bacterium ZFBP1038]